MSIFNSRKMIKRCYTCKRSK